jgi:hypothetical protein
LLQAAFLLGAVGLGLRLLPFRALRRLLARAKVRACQASVERIAWAVHVASRYVPMSTCLSQALVCQVLLSRHGYPASLRIGVTQGAGKRLEAHAWVESEGRIVVGGARDLVGYTPLPPLEVERS